MEFLHNITKDNMTPCFLLAPWLNSSTLYRSIEKIEEVYQQRHYFLDIDYDYTAVKLDLKPQKEFSSLKDSSNSFSNWVEFIEQSKWIIPCVQLHEQSEKDICEQIRGCGNGGRDLCIRISRNYSPSNTNEIYRAISHSNSANIYIILEGGWVPYFSHHEIAALESWFRGKIHELVHGIDTDSNISIIISYTSAPKEFALMRGITRIPLENRTVYESLKPLSNQVNFIYGDWGSTCARPPRRVLRSPWPRIDYPTSDSLYIARNKEEGWTFQDAAAKLMERDGVWGGDSGAWGEEMIRNTAFHEELGINTSPKNVAARINIHLHRQAFYDEPDLGALDLEEDWVD